MQLDKLLQKAQPKASWVLEQWREYYQEARYQGLEKETSAEDFELYCKVVYCTKIR